MGSGKTHIVRATIFILALWLSLIPARTHAAKLYVVYASIGGTQAVGWIAREAGLFVKHGLGPPNKRRSQEHTP